MGRYKLNGVDMPDWLVPVHSEGSNIAVSGAWDMPARTGKTYHNWGDSIEPYVLPEEIKFAGRDLTLKLAARGVDKNDLLRKIYSFYTSIKQMNGAFTLSCDWGTWNVVVEKEIVATYHKHYICELELNLSEAIPVIWNNIPQATNADLGIDGISFNDLGLTITKTTGDFNNPEPKGIREIVIEGVIIANSYVDFNNKVNSIQALFAKEGLRYITREHDALRTFFVKDGFKITGVNVRDKTWGFIEMKITEIGSHLYWSFLLDGSGNEILEINNQKIINI